MNKWTQEEAVDLAITIECICPNFGYHVALTGGCLYRPGFRKDCDFLFYRIRQVKEPDTAGLFKALVRLGFSEPQGLGWCFKSDWKGKGVDMFFPEEVGGEYPPQPPHRLGR